MDKGGPRIEDCLQQIVEERWLEKVTIDELQTLRRRNPKLVAYLRHQNMHLVPPFIRRFRNWIERAKSDRLGYLTQAESNMNGNREEGELPAGCTFKNGELNKALTSLIQVSRKVGDSESASAEIDNLLPSFL